MGYGKLAENMAWHVLIENRIFKFPINMFSLLYSYGIGAYPLEGDNFSNEIEVYRNQGIVTIRCPKFCPEAQLRYRLAHEFGHILLDGLRYGEDDTYHELQADCFANHLLIPSIVLLEQQLNNVEEIVEYFGVPQEIAQLALGRKENISFRNKFFLSHYERRYAKLYNEHKKFPHSVPYWEL